MKLVCARCTTSDPFLEAPRSVIHHKKPLVGACNFCLKPQLCAEYVNEACRPAHNPMNSALRDAQAHVFRLTGLTLSQHAYERFKERFPALELNHEVGQAASHPRQLTKRQMNDLKRGCQGHADKMQVTRYMISHSDVVFVVERGNIVTCFKLGSQ